MDLRWVGIKRGRRRRTWVGIGWVNRDEVKLRQRSFSSFIQKTRERAKFCKIKCLKKELVTEVMVKKPFFIISFRSQWDFIDIFSFIQLNCADARGKTHFSQKNEEEFLSNFLLTHKWLPMWMMRSKSKERKIQCGIRQNCVKMNPFLLHAYTHTIQNLYLSTQPVALLSPLPFVVDMKKVFFYCSLSSSYYFIFYVYVWSFYKYWNFKYLTTTSGLFLFNKFR